MDGKVVSVVTFLLSAQKAFLSIGRTPVASVLSMIQDLLISVGVIFKNKSN